MKTNQGHEVLIELQCGQVTKIQMGVVHVILIGGTLVGLSASLGILVYITNVSEGVRNMSDQYLNVNLDLGINSLTLMIVVPVVIK